MHMSDHMCMWVSESKCMCECVCVCVRFERACVRGIGLSSVHVSERVQINIRYNSTIYVYDS